MFFTFSFFLAVLFQAFKISHPSKAVMTSFGVSGFWDTLKMKILSSSFNVASKTVFDIKKHFILVL